MNKQIVIASLFGTALAAAPNAACTNMVVKALSAALSNAGKTGLKDVTVGLKEAAKKALEAQTADGKLNDASAKDYTDYKTSVQTILDDYDKADKAKKANDAVIADMTLKVTGSGTTIDGTVPGTVGKDGLVGIEKRARETWKAQQDKIDAQLLVNSQIAAAIVLHEEEQKILEEPLIKAKAATEVKRVLAKVAAFEYKNTQLLYNGDGAAAAPAVKSGTVKQLVKAKADTAAIDPATEIAAIDNVADTAVSEYFTKRIDYDKAAGVFAEWEKGCKGKASPATDLCKKLFNTGNTEEDPTMQVLAAKLVLKNNASTDATYVAKKKVFDEAIAAANTKISNKSYATQWEAAVTKIDNDYKVDDGNKKQADTDAKQAVVDTLALETPKQTAVDNVVKYIKQFKLDAARGVKDLKILTDALIPLTEAKVIADFNLQKAKKEKAGYEATKAAAVARRDQKDTAGTDIVAGTDDPTNFATLQKEAKETYDRVKLKLDFYAAAKGVAAAKFKVFEDATKAADGAVTANTNAIPKAQAALDKAIAECKTAEYLRAQENKRVKDEKTVADGLQYNKIKGPYEEKVKASQRAAEPESAGAEGVKKNVANTLCAYPAKKDGAQPPRPKCAEGLCCGAAQRFMKDGTKMAIETCQAKDAHQYTYYPPLAAGATVAPTAQTWRFQCISGAQKLVAAATAALAASYMMA